MQGVPGSGKSQRAREFAAALPEGASTIRSTDDFWFDAAGTYRFDSERAGYAHAWNEGRVAKDLAEGIPLVIVDNTNTRREHVAVYEALATLYSYAIRFERVETPLAECLRRNALRPEGRRVPDETVIRMHEQLAAFESFVS